MTVTSMAQKPAVREFSPNRVAALAPSLKADAKKMPSQASLQKQVDPSRLRAARAVLAGKGDRAGLEGFERRAACSEEDYHG